MKTIWIIAGVAILATSNVAQARSAYDPMRCDALTLQRESRMHMCLSKCERKVLNRKNFDGVACEETCRGRYDRAVARLRRRPTCAPPSADRHQCEAQALKVESRRMLCLSACERKGRRPDFDGPACNALCDTWSDIALAEIIDGPLCADGRSASDPPAGNDAAAQ